MLEYGQNKCTFAVTMKKKIHFSNGFFPAMGTALCIALYAGPVKAQESAMDMVPGFKGNAVYYLLPKTRITVTVNALQTVYTPGELARYAERYLRIANISDQASTEWAIRDISICTTGIPDRSTLYSLELGKKNSNLIRLTPDGMLRSVNSGQEEQSAQASASLTDFLEGAEIADPHQFMTEEILQAGSTAKMAELIAQEIYSIRESRNMITRGEADYIPTDGESLIYVLQQLDRQEKALTSMFTGTTTVENRTFTISCDPDSTLNRHILARFSTRLGVLEPDNLAGEPIWIDIIKADAVTPAQTAAHDKETAKNAFLYYRIPANAAISVYNNRQTYVETREPVAQFGYTTAIPKEWFSKGCNPEITFDTTTGAISSINE